MPKIKEIDRFLIFKPRSWTFTLLACLNCLTTQAIYVYRYNKMFVFFRRKYVCRHFDLTTTTVALHCSRGGFAAVRGDEFYCHTVGLIMHWTMYLPEPYFYDRTLLSCGEMVFRRIHNTGLVVNKSPERRWCRFSLDRRFLTQQTKRS